MIVADIAILIKQYYRDKTGQRLRHLSRFMLILLAESKTMASSQTLVSPEVLGNNLPVLEPMADKIMANIASKDSSELARIMGISRKLAAESLKMAYDFPNKTTGYRAIDAYKGVAFRYFDQSTLTSEASLRLQCQLRIISSAYGILKPEDIIKPYRLEFNKPLAPRNISTVKFFKQKVTVDIVNYIKSNQIREIVNLLPSDADMVCDWKVIRAFAKVFKVTFRTMNHEGHLKTPTATRLKELRGLMAREILQKGIDIFSNLTCVESDHFVYSPADSKPGLPIFLA